MTGAGWFMVDEFMHDVGRVVERSVWWGSGDRPILIAHAGAAPQEHTNPRCVLLPDLLCRAQAVSQS